MQLERGAFDKFRAYLESKTGIVIDAHKQYLVQTRIEPLLKEEGFKDFTDLVEQLCAQRSPQINHLVIDAMTTNETYWFRDTHPFEYFKQCLGAIDSNLIRVWCTACSSGQEPYSLSMSVEEAYQEGMLSRSKRVDIFATDISQDILRVAKNGTYNRLSLSRGLSPKRLSSFFTGNGETKVVKDQIKQRCHFKQFNLQQSFSGQGTFDIVFCRNVLIYFSSAQKIDILKRLHGAIKPGGVLFLGCSESISALGDLYQMHHYKPGIVYNRR